MLIARRCLYAVVAAILLDGAGLAHAADSGKVKCEVVHAGKKQMQYVATAEACTKLGGTVAKTK